MYAESDISDWATGQVGDEAPIEDTDAPPAEAEVEVEEDAPSGVHSEVLAAHAQTIRDMIDTIKADVRAAIVDKALDMDGQDACDDVCDALSLQAESLDELVTLAEAAEELQAEEAAAAEAENEEAEDDEDDDEDEDFEDDEEVE